MSIKLYDDALLNKLKRWTLDTATTLTGVNESTRLFSTIVDQNNDKPIKLPLIALSRPGGFVIEEKYKQPKSYSGATISYNDQRGAKLNAIKISIPYQLDIYARYQEEADELIRNIVFNIINYPLVKIEIPYHDLGIFHDSNIRLSSDVEDNSDVPERLIADQFKRYTIQIVIDDAYLFDIRIKDNLRLLNNYDDDSFLDKESSEEESPEDNPEEDSSSTYYVTNDNFRLKTTDDYLLTVDPELN